MLVDINTTPLIDVMLVLLTLLILTLPIQTHAVKLDMPRPNQPPPTDPNPTVVDLGVDFDGTITWNGDKVDRDDAGHQAAGGRQAKPAAGNPDRSQPAWPNMTPWRWCWRTRSIWASPILVLPVSTSITRP